MYVCMCVYLCLCICVFVCLYVCACVCVFVWVFSCRSLFTSSYICWCDLGPRNTCLSRRKYSARNLSGCSRRLSESVIYGVKWKHTNTQVKVSHINYLVDEPINSTARRTRQASIVSIYALRSLGSPVMWATVILAGDAKAEGRNVIISNHVRAIGIWHVYAPSGRHQLSQQYENQSKHAKTISRPTSCVQ